MYLEKLFLRNFRNYQKAEVSFSEKINLFLGNNGHGKTNLLEAIYLLSTGRSFRTRHFSELLFSGAPFFYLEGHFSKEGVSHLIKIYYDEKTRKIQYDGTISSHFTMLLGVLPGVLISPDDHEIIAGAPADRRRFLDIYLSQSDPLYIQYLSRYFGAMKQRNHLLKKKEVKTLPAWDETLALAGTYLIQKRKAALKTLNPLVSSWMETLSAHQDPTQVLYSPSIDTADPAIFALELKKLRAKELHLGSTLLGPHRDEIEILLKGQKAKDFASEGQKRTLMTALKFAEWELLKDATEGLPLLSIDDFGLGLDALRQKILEEKIQHLGQVFLTAAKPLTFLPDCTLLINQGVVNTQPLAEIL